MSFSPLFAQNLVEVLRGQYPLPLPDSKMEEAEVPLTQHALCLGSGIRGRGDGLALEMALLNLTCVA